MIGPSLSKTQLLGFLRPLNPQAPPLGVFLWANGKNVALSVDTPWLFVVTIAPLLGVEAEARSR